MASIFSRGSSAVEQQTHNLLAAGSSPAHASQTQRELRRYPAAWSVTGLLGTPAPNRAAGTLSMPAWPPRPQGVWLSTAAGAGAFSSPSVRTARFSPGRSRHGLFSSVPAPAGIRRDSSFLRSTQATWAPRA